MASSVPKWMKDAGVEAVEGSVTNSEDIANAVSGVSAIFHLAGKVSRDNRRRGRDEQDPRAGHAPAV